MPRIHRTIALALLLPILLLSGCGGSAASTATAAASEATQTAAETAAETTAAETEAPASETPAAVISYPIAGGITLSIWRPFESFMWGALLSGYQDMPMLQNIEDATGITIQFTSVDDKQSTEAFNLMIASGDWDDMVNLQSYTGGLSKALEDSICYDMTDHLDEWMPDYAKALDDLSVNFPNAYKQTLTDDGKTLAAYSINDEYSQEQGLLYRADWAAAAGLDGLETIDDVTKFMDYVVAQYHPEYGMTASSGGVIDCVVGAFGVPGFDASGTSANLGLYLDTDGNVASTITADGYRDYIEWFNQMYKAKAIKDDFYSETYGPDWVNSYLSDDNVAMTTIRSDKISTVTNDATTPGYELKASLPIVKEAGDTYGFGTEKSVVQENFSIMSTSEHPQECMEFLNWFFTDDGYVLSNYGQEGLSFEYNADGDVEFTDLIMKSDYNNKVQVKNLYGGMVFPCVKDTDCFYYTYADVEREAIELWSQTSDAQTIPTFTLGSEDSEQITTTVSDIVSYAATQVMKWMTGEEQLTDDSWQSYVDTCNSMGLPDAVAVYQKGYESFEAR